MCVVQTPTNPRSTKSNRFPKEIRIIRVNRKESEKREPLLSRILLSRLSIDRPIIFFENSERFARLMAERIRRAEYDNGSPDREGETRRRRRRVGGRSSVPLSKRGRARHSRKFRSSRGWNDDKFTRVRRERGKKKNERKGVEIR